MHVLRCVLVALALCLVSVTAIQPIRRLAPMRFKAKHAGDSKAELTERIATDEEMLAQIEQAEAGGVTDSELPKLAEECAFRARRAWRDHTHEQRLHFLHAVAELKSQPIREDLTDTLYDAFVDKYDHNYDATHGNSFFLPWNRAFLLQFENALRSTATGKAHCVTLPYWDFSRDFQNRTQLAEEFFTADYFGSFNDECFNAGPLAGWTDKDGSCVQRNPSPRFKFPGPAQLQRYMADYPQYGGHTGGIRRALESLPHAMPKLHLGGANAGRRAVADPLAWLHLAFIDHLWSMWQHCYGYDKIASNEINEIIYMHTSDATRPDNELPGFKNRSPRDVHSIFELGYGYANDEFIRGVEFDAICTWNTQKAAEKDQAEAKEADDNDGGLHDLDDAVDELLGDDDEVSNPVAPTPANADQAKEEAKEEEAEAECESTEDSDDSDSGFTSHDGHDDGDDGLDKAVELTTQNTDEGSAGDADADSDEGSEGETDSNDSDDGSEGETNDGSEGEDADDAGSEGEEKAGSEGEDSDNDGSSGATETNEADSDSNGSDGDADADADADDLDAGFLAQQTSLVEVESETGVDALTVLNECFFNHLKGEVNNKADALREAVGCECKIVGDHAPFTQEFIELNHLKDDYATGSDETDYCSAFRKNMTPEDEDGPTGSVVKTETVYVAPEPKFTVVPAAALD